MSDLGFELEYLTRYGGRDSLPCIVSDAGVRREATPEEEKLWQALAEARGRIAELEAEAALEQRERLDAEPGTEGEARADGRQAPAGHRGKKR